MTTKDQRAKWRFGLERELRYKLLDGDTIVAAGVGRSVDISSSGLGFLGQHQVKEGALVEVSMSWPVMLDEVPMRLVVFGRVVRATTFFAACTIDRYEFRTQARARENPIPIRNDFALRRFAETVRGKVAMVGATA